MANDQSLAKSAASAAANNYDKVPYAAQPKGLLQPGYMGAVARLSGCQAADPATARVLEIGCATGGHLIPLAAQFPQSQFTGLDVSPVQIEMGRERIARLGLTNIRLEALSIADFEAPEASFDYIICQGVFSWVPGVIRTAIAERCGKLLAPHGIGMISFNVLPGWRTFQVLRDTARLHCAQFDTPREKAEAMRALFATMRTYATEKSSYGQVWKLELDNFLNKPDFYLLHEFLEENNNPMTFDEFIAEITPHGLYHLGNAELMSNIVENAGYERGALIHTLADEDKVARERYIDIATGRTFRMALVTPSRPAAGDITDHLHLLAGMHITAPHELAIAEAGEGLWKVSVGEGRTMEIRSAASARAVQQILADRPSSSSYDALMAMAEGPGELDGLEVDLRRMVCMGYVEVSLVPTACGRLPVEKPRAWAVALDDAKAGEEVTSTLRHEPFRLDPRPRFILSLCDGAHSMSEIEDKIFEILQSGGAKVSDKGEVITDPERLRDVAKQAVAKDVGIFAEAGLLAPA